MPTELPARTRRTLPPSLSLIAAAAVAGAMVLAVTRPQAVPSARLQTAYWYWHRPFRLEASEQKHLAESGTGRLYVLAGTVVRRGSQLKLESRQQWAAASPVPVHAVFRVHSAALDLLLDPTQTDRAAELVRQAQLPSAVQGIQWDADIPTARLRDYRSFLERLHSLLPAATILGVTALPDWLRSPEFGELCGAVDEIAPQFYGNRLPQDGREPPALWETDDLLGLVRRSAAGRARVWVGLPAYGRCLVLDDRGRFVGERHDLQPEALLADPTWEIRQAATRSSSLGRENAPFASEDSLLLWNRENTWTGSLEFPAGTSLWFQWPRAEGLRAATRILSDSPTPGVAGVCFFRWPAPEEALGLAPVSLESAPPGARAAGPAELQVQLVREGDRIRVRVRNPGPDTPRLGPGIRLEVSPGGGQVDASGTVAWFQGEAPASPLRADRARFETPLVRAGVDWEPCTILRSQEGVISRLSWTGAAGPQLSVARLAPPLEERSLEHARD